MMIGLKNWSQSWAKWLQTLGQIGGKRSLEITLKGKSERVILQLREDNMIINMNSKAEIDSFERGNKEKKKIEPL